MEANRANSKDNAGYVQQINADDAVHPVRRVERFQRHDIPMHDAVEQDMAVRADECGQKGNFPCDTNGAPEPDVQNPA
jgi:hypothetical protein